jgi:hypothetical protein
MHRRLVPMTGRRVPNTWSANSGAHTTIHRSARCPPCTLVAGMHWQHSQCKRLPLTSLFTFPNFCAEHHYIASSTRQDATRHDTARHGHGHDTIRHLTPPIPPHRCTSIGKKTVWCFSHV